MNMMTVPFHGDSLYVVNHNGEPYVPMKPVVEGMGMDWKTQFRKLQQRFKSCVVEMTIQLPGDIQCRPVTCLALRKLAGWLQTISPNKVKPEIRDRVIQYQNECDDVLYEYWTKGVVVNPRRLSVMEELNQACADMKRDKNIASLFGTGLNEWKTVKAAHVSKIRALVDEASLLIDFVLADTGKGKVTKNMSRKHWTHRMPRTAAKWALVAILVPFFLVGCVSLDKARQLFDAASQVCEIVDGVRQCMQN